MTDTAPAAPKPAPRPAPQAAVKPAPKAPAKPAAKKARKPVKPKRDPLVVRLAARARGMRFRVLPLMIFVAVLLLGVRVGEMWRVATRDYRLPEFPTSLAQNPPAAPAAPASSAPAPSNVTPGEGNKPNGAPPAGAPLPAAAPPPPGGASTMAMAPADGELAQHFAGRRAELERRMKDVEQREALLAAAEKRIDQKLQELDKVRGDIQKLLRTGDEKQNAQLESLVKIYETMKPKEAARIFEELDMPVLLDVIQRMKEQKTAPILASMDPVKAKEVTSALVERRVMPALPQ